MSEISGVGRGRGFFDKDSRRVEPIEPIVPTGLGKRPPKENGQGRPKNKEEGKGTIFDGTF